jgi:hypothetical protein
MTIWHPTRRLLGFPAWFWVVLPIPFLALGSSLSTFWLPSNLDEPPERDEIFRDPILITRRAEAYRFVPYSEQKGVKPLWNVNIVTSSKQNLKWSRRNYLPGLFRRQASWNYQLTANRFDSDWKNDKLNPLTLPVEQIRRDDGPWCRIRLLRPQGEIPQAQFQERSNRTDSRRQERPLRGALGFST